MERRWGCHKAGCRSASGSVLQNPQRVGRGAAPVSPLSLPSWLPKALLPCPPPRTCWAALGQGATPAVTVAAVGAGRAQGMQQQHSLGDRWGLSLQVPHFRAHTCNPDLADSWADGAPGGGSRVHPSHPHLRKGAASRSLDLSRKEAQAQPPSLLTLAGTFFCRTGTPTHRRQRRSGPRLWLHDPGRTLRSPPCPVFALPRGLPSPAPAARSSARMSRWGWSPSVPQGKPPASRPPDGRQVTCSHPRGHGHLRAGRSDSRPGLGPSRGRGQKEKGRRGWVLRPAAPMHLFPLGSSRVRPADGGGAGAPTAAPPPAPSRRGAGPKQRTLSSAVGTRLYKRIKAQ